LQETSRTSGTGVNQLEMFWPALQGNYIPNSIKVASAIGHWQLGIGLMEHNAMLCLNDRQTIASQCAIAQCPKRPLLN